MQVRQHPFPFFISAVLVALCIPCGRSAADVIYVDNRIGNDANDGAANETLGLRSGPVKTIRRALQIARRADTVVIANRGVPYYESISLTGRRHSGFQLAKFTIVGNGAVIDGSRLVSPSAWKEVAPGLWRLTLWRKAHYQLILDDQLVPEMSVPAGAKMLPKIPPGQWAAWRGSIYYQSTQFGAPSTHPFAVAHEDVGLTLTEVHDVHVTGLTFRHFRLDGVSAHSLCRGIVLEKVQLQGNGRAGLFVGGTSAVEVIDCGFSANRRHNVLIRGRHAVMRAVPELPEPPTFID